MAVPSRELQDGDHLAVSVDAVPEYETPSPGTRS
jgi:hypothetical protein